MYTPISILVLTYNEAARIQATLGAAMAIGDEVLVVDSHSTDDTVELATKMGAKVLTHSFTHWSAQRNWSMQQASHEWVLFLDADEVLDAELIQSLREWKRKAHVDPQAYWGLKRIHYYKGKRMRYSGLQSDVVVRLFHKSRKYEDKWVHERINVAKPKPLKGTLHHFSYLNEKHWQKKLRSYAIRSAKDHARTTQTITPYHWLIKPCFRFFKHFLLRGGLLDGSAGFYYSLDMYRSVKWRYDEMKKLQK